MLNRFYTIIVILLFSSCTEGNDLDGCNSNLLLTYQKVISFESLNTSAREIPLALKQELAELLSKCKNNNEPFILIRDFLSDGESAFVTYLDLSIISGNVELFDFFISRKKIMSPKTRESSHFMAGWSYLHVAARYGEEQHIEVLLNEGEDINTKDLYGMTPLMLTFDNLKNFSFLIKRGADPHIQNKSGLSAACWAVELGEAKLISFMNRRGIKCESSEN